MSDPDQPGPIRRAACFLAWTILAVGIAAADPALPDPTAPAPSAAPAAGAIAEPASSAGPSLPPWIVPAILVLLLASGFASGSETALFSLSRGTLKRYETASAPTPNQRAIVYLMADTKQTLATLLILNNVVNIATSLLVGATMVYLVGDHPVLSFLFGTVVATLALLILGEIFPKSLAMERAETIANVVARPIATFRRLLAPVRALLMLVVEAIFRLLRLPPETSAEVTEQEIRSLIAQGLTEGVVEDEEREMISGVFDLDDLTVDKMMTPRVSIQAYPDTIDRADLEREVIDGDHSRVLIYHENIDRIVGVLHAKELLLNTDRPVQELMREPMFVPPKKQASRLLEDFRRKRQHIAVVLDEYGGTAGCITLNDVLEQIVGDILESDEPDPATIRSRDERHYEIDGLEEIDEINDRLGIALPLDRGQTLSGLILNSLGDLARAGDEVTVEGGFRLRVERMAQRHVAVALLELPEPLPGADAAHASADQQGTATPPASPTGEHPRTSSDALPAASGDSHRAAALGSPASGTYRTARSR